MKKQYNIICIEGIDELEREKIAKRIAIKLEVPFVQIQIIKTISKRRIFEELAYVFNQTLLQFKDISYVVDKGPLNSIIMSMIFQRKSKLDYIYPLIKELNPFFIYLTTSKTSVIFKRSSNLSNTMKIFRGYKRFFKTQRMFDVLEIDIKDFQISETVELILKKLKNKIIFKT